MGTRPSRQGEDGQGVDPESVTTSGTGALVLPASSGWHTRIDGEFEQPKGVIGIIVAQKFPDPEIIRIKLEEGIERVSPDTVWVMREAERKDHAVNFAWQTFRSHGITPLLAPLVPAWQRKRKIEYREHLNESGRVVFLERVITDPYDLRAAHRDIEMRATCERIIVFHDKSSNVSGEWIEYRDNNLSIAKIYVVERGKARAKRYKKGTAPN